MLNWKVVLGANPLMATKGLQLPLINPKVMVNVGGTAVFVGVSDAVAEGGTAVFVGVSEGVFGRTEVLVGVSVGVRVGGIDVFVGVSVGVLVGGTEVLVGVLVAVLVGGTEVLVDVAVGDGGVFVGVKATQMLFRQRAPEHSASVQQAPGARQIPLQTSWPVGQQSSSP